MATGQPRISNTIEASMMLALSSFLILKGLVKGHRKSLVALEMDEVSQLAILVPLPLRLRLNISKFWLQLLHEI